MSATETKITVDRSVIKEFIAQVDGLATYDMLVTGCGETFLTELVYGLLTPFEKATLGPMSDDDSEALHDRGHEYGRKYFDQLVTRGPQ